MGVQTTKIKNVIAKGIHGLPDHRVANIVGSVSSVVISFMFAFLALLSSEEINQYDLLTLPVFSLFSYLTMMFVLAMWTDLRSYIIVWDDQHIDYVMEHYGNEGVDWSIISNDEFRYIKLYNKKYILAYQLKYGIQ